MAERDALPLHWSIMKRVVLVVVFLFGSILLAIVMEWIGMTFVWTQQGVEHSRAMVSSEFEALSMAIQPDAFASEWVATQAALLITTLYGWMAQDTGLESLALSVSGFWFVNYLEAALNATQAFLMRLVVVILTIPAFFLVAAFAIVEGLTLRTLRRYGGGHESAWVFHNAKRFVWPSILLPTVTYLSMPFTISPVVVFAPALVAFGVVTTLMVSKFKKFL